MKHRDRPFLNDVQWIWLIGFTLIGVVANGWIGALVCGGFVLSCATYGYFFLD